MSYLLIGLGGYIGAIIRYVISIHLNNKQFFLPIGTFLVNIVGSALLATFYSLYQLESISNGLWEFLGIGFCGAFTTFSTFSVELLNMIQKKQWHHAVGYAIASFTISFVTFYTIMKLII